MSKNHFNSIVIIDSIPSGELNTARRLREDLEIIACAFTNGLKIEYLRVDTITDIETGISYVLRDLKDKGLFPLLHLEGHGFDTENGFTLPDGSCCSWTQFNKFITPVNVAMELNLMLVMATCYGGSFVKSIMTTDRAPLWGLIGPTRELTAGQVQTDFVKFYQILFEKTSTDAINTLVAQSPAQLYYLESAQNWFYAVWESYKDNECTKEKIDQRARKMYRKAKADGIPRIPSVGQLKRTIRSKEKEYFDRFRDTYFMYDLHPSNRDRFPVTYEKAETLRIRNSKKK